MKINFNKISKLSVIIAAALTVVSVLMLILFGGNTFASYTMQNLRPSLFVKAFVAAVLVLGLTIIYFLIRHKKKGLFLGLFSALSAVISAVTAFAFCVICRAPLGGLTFAVMLFAVVLTYVTAVIFSNNLAVKKVSRKKNAENTTDNYTIAADSTWRSIAPVVAIICVVLVVAFVLSLVFKVAVLPAYAIPAVLTAIFSVIQTIAFGCKLYSDKA